ncbi:type II toxin-antitoxin system RelE/ParE family toxin [Ruminobacter sp. RM87]|uniref:type II toxin-antitoxin system RelE/ParE family toxin n=1 Tax=Ruminobacter sp. RM87 TaxID=1200567 RepID=UPI0012FB1A71
MLHIIAFERIKNIRVVSLFNSGYKDMAPLILTNGFVKKTQRTPPAEIELAKKRRYDYITRMEKS